MPLYHLCLVVRPLAKPDLVNVLKGCCTRLLEDGAIITKIESLGYRDLPYKMKRPNQPKAITGNYTVVDFYAPLSVTKGFEAFRRQNLDLLHAHYHPAAIEQPKEECTLFEELKPPAYRKSVEELRANKKMARLSRELAVLRARNLMKREPKSYHIAPFRK